jgi:hypothetical protein
MVVARECLTCGTAFEKKTNPSRATRIKYCSLHCARAARGYGFHGRPPELLTPRQRFLNALVRLGRDDCWPWRGTVGANGYGNIRVDGHRVSAHRMAYEVLVGEVPDGILVLHHCDNPACCNPRHLFLGTAKDNTQDMIAKGRAHWQRAS